MKVPPTLSAEAMREVDLLITSQTGIPRIMEAVAIRTVDFLLYSLTIPFETPICAVAGKGHNGGDAVAVARILQGFGRPVSLLLAAHQDECSDETKAQIGLFTSFKGTCVEDLPSEGVLIDGLLGTGVTKNPHGNIATLIQGINESGLHTLSLDLPSGLNGTTGEPFDPCIRATWTLTYHVPKSGLLEETASPYIGELWVCETDLTFTAFQGLEKNLRELYRNSPIVKLS